MKTQLTPLLQMHSTTFQSGTSVTLVSSFGLFLIEILSYPHTGPTSNHALFRTLSGIFAQTARSRAPLPQQSMQSTMPKQSTISLNPHRESDASGQQFSAERMPDHGDPYALPQDQGLRTLVYRFFETVGAVLPYVNKSVLLEQCNRVQHEDYHGFYRSKRALLNIVCAHASLSLPGGTPEVFYRRALTWLDSLTLRGSSLELGETNINLARTIMFQLTAFKSRRFSCSVVFSKIANAL